MLRRYLQFTGRGLNLRECRSNETSPLREAGPSTPPDGCSASGRALSSCMREFAVDGRGLRIRAQRIRIGS